MSADLQKTIDEIGRTITEFRALNDRRYEELKARGAEGAEARAAADKANAAIVALEEKLEAEAKKLREMETLTARLDLSPSSQKDQEREHAQSFFAMGARARKEPVPQVGPQHVEQFRAYRRALDQYLRDPQKALGNPVIQAALTIGSDPAGGYWVTPETTGRITQLLFETSPMRRLAFVQPTGKDRIIGWNDLDEAGAGWVAETGARSETTTPELGRYEIPVHEMYANPKASQSLLDDADVDMEAWLGSKVGDKLARTEAAAFVTANGVGKPRGFVDYANASAPTKANWQRVEFAKTGVSADFAAAPNGGDIFITLMGLMKAPLLAGAVWAMNRTTKAAARKLKDSNGHYVLLPDFRDGFRELILGMVVEPFEDMAAIAANSYSVALANFREGYTIADRQGIRVLRDPYTAKPYVHLYTTARVGGDVTNFEAIKLAKFIN